MDVRIGMMQSLRELEVEMDDSTDRDALREQIATALAEDGAVITIEDIKGREIILAASRINYVDLGAAKSARSIGFAATS